MGDASDIAFLYPSGGMNGAGCSTRLTNAQYRRGTNVALIDEVPSTRYGVRVHRLNGDAAARSLYGLGNVQGARFFNPAAGQDGLNFQTASPSILVANGGKKYCIYIDGSGVGTVATLKDISQGIQQPAKLHLVWWSAAEYFAFAQDGRSDCFIWDASTGTAALSNGYDTIDRPSSMIPNGATVMLYVHGRVAAVVNSKFILYGDSIHKTSLTSAKNLLEFQEQTYWNTGQFFLPPSDLGPIQAAAILPVEDTQHGHAEAIYHCAGGIFSVETNVAPRSDWPTKAAVKTARGTFGAVGPYAVATRSSDQIFRTPEGIDTLRSSRLQRQVEGNPQASYSAPVDTFFAGDVPEWLRFCSLEVWQREARLFCTVDPTLDGRWRWHSGVVVRNFAPKPAETSPACWEGLWTMPPECAGIVQLVAGNVRGEERLFALCRGADGINRLAEFDPELSEDVLEDGSRVPIRCQLLTRAMAFTDPFKKKQFLRGTLIARNARGKVQWGVWVRRHGTHKFTFWRGGTINAPGVMGEFGLDQAEPFSGEIPLGEFPKSCETKQGGALWFEFLIRWSGAVQIETLRVYADADTADDKLNEALFNITVSDPLAGGYSDFEYSAEQAWSINPQTANA